MRRTFIFQTSTRGESDPSWPSGVRCTSENPDTCPVCQKPIRDFDDNAGEGDSGQRWHFTCLLELV